MLIDLHLHWIEAVSKWPDLPIMVRRSERNLAFKRPFCRCFGIVLKHSMDTTRHVFCSRSIRISFERVCFRLHPESSLRCLQTFSNPRTYQETKDFWMHRLHRRNRRMALFCAFLKYFQWSPANRMMWNRRESTRDTRPPLTGRDPASDSQRGSLRHMKRGTM